MKRAVWVAFFGVACHSAQPPAQEAPSADTAQVAAAPVAVAAPRHFGAPFTVNAAQPLAQAVSAASAPDKDGKAADSCASAGDTDGGKKVRVRGTVTSVCQKAGCWMVLADGATEARIFMKDHAFTMPKDCAGKTAEVEGTLKAKTISPQFAKHLAEDAGKDPNKEAAKDASKCDAAAMEYVVSATGVDLVD